MVARLLSRVVSRIAPTPHDEAQLPFLGTACYACEREALETTMDSMMSLVKLDPIYRGFPTRSLPKATEVCCLGVLDRRSIQKSTASAGCVHTTQRPHVGVPATAAMELDLDDVAHVHRIMELAVGARHTHRARPVVRLHGGRNEANE